MRPAKGCNFDASGNEALPRKDDASCAEEGSNGWGAKVVVGAESVERVSPDGVCCFEDFLPVKASQMDIAKTQKGEGGDSQKDTAGMRLKQRLDASWFGVGISDR